ncbi:hypothetical protein OG474_41500 [Kribbella sp. NBC_01505]|uniref:hypothetical protein n=1 Tax=Kribbella sp. NBC_01505 TaxID=2903580 RepID=UPI003870ED9A
MFEIAEAVTAAVDLGGLVRGKVVAGTPGIVTERLTDDGGTTTYTVEFTIERDDLLTANHTTLHHIDRECLSRSAHDM